MILTSAISRQITNLQRVSVFWNGVRLQVILENSLNFEILNVLPEFKGKKLPPFTLLCLSLFIEKNRRNNSYIFPRARKIYKGIKAAKKVRPLRVKLLEPIGILNMYLIALGWCFSSTSVFSEWKCCPVLNGNLLSSPLWLMFSVYYTAMETEYLWFWEQLTVAVSCLIRGNPTT